MHIVNGESEKSFVLEFRCFCCGDVYDREFDNKKEIREYFKKYADKKLIEKMKQDDCFYDYECLDCHNQAFSEAYFKMSGGRFDF